MNTLKNRTLFISGGSRGIGLAIALRAARDGANVVIAAKTAEPHPKLEGTIYTAAEEIEAAGGKALPVLCDIRDEQQIQAAVDAAAERFGGIDICINNASAISLTPTSETDVKRFDLMLQINVRGTFLVTKACLPHLLHSSNPHVLSLGPPPQLVPQWFAPYPAYALSKYAMSLYAMGMAEEYRDRGVAFNTLWPKTLIATAAVRNVVAGEQGVTRSRSPAIMADAAHWILTRQSREFTGQHCIDEQVIISTGLKDLRRYRTVTGDGELETDLFVADGPKDAGIQV